MLWVLFMQGLTAWNVIYTATSQLAIFILYSKLPLRAVFGVQWTSYVLGYIFDLSKPSSNLQHLK
jgi:hypothetical protein